MIFRVDKNTYYTTINNTCLKDERLSWKAKGIMAYLLSLPNDWKINIIELKNHSTDGEDSLRSGIDELKKLGYIERFAIRNEQTQRIVRWVFNVYETPHRENPQVEKPHMEKPHMENPQVENPTLLNTNNTNYLTIVNTDNIIIVEYEQIITYLNQKANTNYKATSKKTKDLINARMKERFTVNDFYRVIDNKCAEWLGTEWEKYLRPETLFGNKFESYLNQTPKIKKMTTKDLDLSNVEFDIFS